MTDHFQEKAKDWDTQPVPAQISAGVWQAIEKEVELSSALEVMDFGAGTGLICARLAPHVANVCAVDVSPAMLDQLAAKPELRGKVEVICQDILVSSLGRQFDLVVSAMAMHHVEDTQTLLQTFAEHLRPGGHIALADLDTEDGSFHPPETVGVYHQGFDREVLRASLQRAGFSNISFTTAVEVERDGRRYPVFLVTAVRV